MYKRMHSAETVSSELIPTLYTNTFGFVCLYIITIQNTPAMNKMF